MKVYGVLSVFLVLLSFYDVYGVTQDSVIIDFFQKQASTITEGHMTFEQQQQFNEALASYSHIKNILEIGFNGGHSAQNFLAQVPDVTLVSLDLNEHSYTQVAVDFLKSIYKKRFVFFPGDSKITVPMCSREFLQQKFDLIYIDGDHSFKGCKTDIENCRSVAHEGTILWIDDYTIKPVNKAIKHCAKRKFIEIIKIHRSTGRIWVEARFRTS